VQPFNTDEWKFLGFYFFFSKFWGLVGIESSGTTFSYKVQQNAMKEKLIRELTCRNQSSILKFRLAPVFLSEKSRLILSKN
jgi:hypothetical protein